MQSELQVRGSLKQSVDRLIIHSRIERMARPGRSNHIHFLAYFVDCFDSGRTPTVHFFLSLQTQKRRRLNPREAAKPQADHLLDFASHVRADPPKGNAGDPDDARRMRCLDARAARADSE